MVLSSYRYTNIKNIHYKPQGRIKTRINSNIPIFVSVMLLIFYFTISFSFKYLFCHFLFLFICLHFLFSYNGQSCIVNDLFPVLMSGDDVTNSNDDCSIISSSRNTISTTSLEYETFGKGPLLYLGFA